MQISFGDAAVCAGHDAGVMYAATVDGGVGTIDQAEDAPAR
jgi:hypothetical protein